MEGAMKDFVENELAAVHFTISALYADQPYRRSLAAVARLFIETLKAGRILLFAGNGGSAADAQHIAGELVSRFHFDRPGLAAIALTTDTSILTAIDNDYGYERVFARQIEAIGNAGDVFVGISTSGNSPNILAAVDAAKRKGLKAVGLTGKTGGRMRDVCDYMLCAPSDVTPRVQECHLATYHLLCGLVEEAMFGKSSLTVETVAAY